MEARAEGAVVRERPGCVLGIAFGIMVLGSLIAFLWLPRTEKRDGGQLIEAWIGARELPAGYEIREAAKLIGGQEVVKLANAAAPAEKPRAAGAKPAKGAGPMPRVDWGRVAMGAPDQAPLTLLFVHYPENRSKSELARLFSEKLSVGRLDEIPESGGRMLLELGTLAWEGANPAYVLERNFEVGGTFKDIVRVNLSNVEPGLVLNAEWSRSEPFSKARLQAVLDALRRR